MLTAFATPRIPIVGLAAILTIAASAPAAAQFTRPPSRPPTVFKPGPAPQNVRLSGTPITTTITWSPPAGIDLVGTLVYSVQRWLESDPDCCKNQVTGLTTTTWFDEGLQWSGAYIYRVSVAYPDGSIGLVDTRYVRPEPVNPANFRGSQVSAGTVVLKWDPVWEVTWYQLYGAGTLMPGSTIALTGITTYLVRNLPLGTYSWRLCSVYAAPHVAATASTPVLLCPEATVVVRY